MGKKRVQLGIYEVTMKQIFRNDEGQIEEKDVVHKINPKAEMYILLRAPGLFQDGRQIVEAVCIAREINSCKDDYIDLNENDLELVQTAFNKLISKEHDPANGKQALGGELYEEMIMRVFRAEDAPSD